MSEGNQIWDGPGLGEEESDPDAYQPPPFRFEKTLRTNAARHSAYMQKLDAERRERAREKEAE